MVLIWVVDVQFGVVSALYLPWAVNKAVKVRRNVQIVTNKSPFILSKDVGDEKRNAFLCDANKTFSSFWHVLACLPPSNTPTNFL